jgi:hypothetical protein
MLLPSIRLESDRTPMIHKPNLQSVPEQGNIGRRAVLGALAAGSIGGSIASLAPIPVAAKAADKIADDRRKARYRESEEVRTFYRVNRYP